MFLDYIIMASCVSIDSLGTGITYGLKNTKISKIAIVILFIFSTFITTISLFIGNIFSNFFSNFMCSLIGCLILFSMGLLIVFQSLKNDQNKCKNIFDSKTSTKHSEETVYQFFIRFLGITIQIIRNPKSSDLDNSNNIDSKEAIFLATALSLDSMGVGIGCSMMGINSSLFPILVSCFQLAFLFIGKFIGRKIRNISSIPDNICNIVSGLILIFIGISRLF